MRKTRPSPTAPAFDLVSVKPSGDHVVEPDRPAPALDNFRFSGQRARCDEQLRDMFEFAYSVHDFQIVGPDWLGRLTYAVDAVKPADAPKSDAPLMVRRMLTERFKLQFHREQREPPVYPPLIGKGVMRLQPVIDPSKRQASYCALGRKGERPRSRKGPKGGGGRKA